MIPDESCGTPAASEALSNAVIDTVLTSLFGAVPAPRVMAAGESGMRVSFPAGVPIKFEQVITEVNSALDLCIEADLSAMVDAWVRARRMGGAQVSIHLKSDPDRVITLHFLDARHRFGVFFAFFVGLQGSVGEIDADALRIRPKMCTIRRSEIAVTLSVDSATTKVVGWSDTELIGSRILDLTHPDDKATSIANWMDMLARPGGAIRTTARLRHADGRFLWFEATHTNLLSDPACGYVVTELLDVSDRMEAIEALRASEELLRRLTETLPLGILQIDVERRIVYRNERLGAIAGIDAMDTLDDLLANVVDADREALDSALSDLLETGQSADVEFTLTVGGSERRRCSAGMRALSTEKGAVYGAIVCISDITESVRLRSELEIRAKYDTLTRCHNRASILEQLQLLLAAPESSRTGMAVMFADLNRFKEVNDHFGHAAGDDLLRLTGERLMKIVRENDTVGRLGGDEFLIVCPGVESPQLALDIGHRLAAGIAEPISIAGRSFTPGSSIGIAWTDGPIFIDALVAIADGAMYESKRGDHAPILRIAEPQPAVAEIV